ncbi:MAG: transglycosylase SLT domain-containing protein, partial [Candidatus Hydrogenedentes bacterium]|nr:transglycosylase SLT domain-containing protein [Candidatus Hydrogenedentota bacterium]
MHHTYPFIRSIVAGSTALLLYGCATTRSSEVIQFDPIPIAEIGTLELEPIEPRSIAELLSAAQHAFDSANEAQEDGDTQRALGQYTLMLELLLESEIDPSIYYALRGEYGKILNTTSLHARAFERDPSLTWSEELAVIAVRSDLDYPFPLPERVLSEVREIQDRYPEAFEKGLNRSARYLPYIREEFAKAGLPEDLVWLAMVESQFTPRIVSRAGAGGMWQFMRSTGRHYGLRIDGTVDERYDWKLSTQAAIKYLSNLHEMFDGEWPLAISAYNMGEAGLSRAIAANGGERNLWRLIETPPAANRIRRETKKFYPKLLASVIVSKNPRRYGMTKPRLAGEQSAYATVEGSYSLRDIERAIGLPTSTLKQLNPQLLRGITPPGRTSEILVPTNARIQVASVLASLPEYRADTHVVQRGETLSKIAKHYHVNTRELMETNNIRSAKRLQIGQRLAIPRAVGA